MAVLAWAISEVIRYWYYACSLIGNIPYFIVYLRYIVCVCVYILNTFSDIIGTQCSIFYILLEFW